MEPLTDMPSVPRREIVMGVDWAFGSIDYKILRNMGYHYAIRYAVPTIQGKCITHAEVLSAFVAGVDIGLVYETTGQTWRGGYAQGVIDAQNMARVLNNLGAPYSVAGYHAVDENVPSDMMHVVLNWVQGLRTGMEPYRVGVYGQASVMNAVHVAYPDVFLWQTLAWSGNQTWPFNDLLQAGSKKIGGVDVDIDSSYNQYWGQWYSDPAKQPYGRTERDVVTGCIPPETNLPVTFMPGGMSTCVLYFDTASTAGKPQKVRVAFHSQSLGYKQIEEVTLDNSSPRYIVMQQRDVNAVSFSTHYAESVTDIAYAIY